MSLHKNSLLIMTMMTIVLSTNSWAATPIVEIRIRGHLFYPSEVIVPSNTKVKLLVINEDPTAEEFESYELNREKVIIGNSKAIIFIGPLQPGEYPFFGEFNMSTALGKIVAE